MLVSVISFVAGALAYWLVDTFFVWRSEDTWRETALDMAEALNDEDRGTPDALMIAFGSLEDVTLDEAASMAAYVREAHDARREALYLALLTARRERDEDAQEIIQARH